MVTQSGMARSRATQSGAGRRRAAWTASLAFAAVAAVGSATARQAVAQPAASTPPVPTPAAAEAKRTDGLKDGDYVAVIGDSITEQKQYSVLIEAYLVACQPAEGLRATQFGWGGETAPGFLGRMTTDFLPFKASVATTCYGMNDGGYSPLDDKKAKTYRDAQTKVVKRMKEAGVRFVVVGTPGCVDSDTFRKDANNPKQATEASTMYNQTLAGLGQIAKEVATAEGVGFADVFGVMADVMPKAKAKYGPAYHVGGKDGVHPDANGHLLMAYAFLKGLGVSGDVGTVTVDLAAGKVEGSAGHKVEKPSLGGAARTVEVESTRYPFCTYGDPKSPSSARGVLEFVPFDQDLNRYTLVVKGLKGDKATVTWGTESKAFPAADLAKGVNLAAEFRDNPFAEPFKAVTAAVLKKQAFETPMVKTFLHGLPEFERLLPEEKETFGKLKSALFEKHKPMAAAVAESVKPVRHTIKIEE
jgi:lysophospholipase L1-like esterase